MNAFDIEKWLNAPLQNGQPRYRRIAFLVVANGGFDVRQWGIISYGSGHQQGLDQNDALELLQWSAYMDGISACGIDVHSAFWPKYQAYRSEIEQPTQDENTTAGGDCND